MPGYNIAGKVFFITGGAAGIGLGLVEGVLAKHGKIFFIDIDDQAGQRRLKDLASRFGPGNVGFAQCDVTDRKRFEESFREAVTKFGQVDVMINNAGLLEERKPKVAVDINLLGTIYGTEIAASHMRKDKGGKGGRIINVSSFTGLYSIPTMPVYCATKHAVRAYTDSWSKHPQNQEWGLEYAVLLPDSVLTDGYNRLTKKWLYEPSGHKEAAAGRLQTLDEFTKTALDFLELGKINGVLMMLTKTKKCFMKMRTREVGNLYPSSL